MHHRQTTLYKATLHLAAQSRLLTKKLPTGHRHLADQLNRASTSITLNLAEGCGKSTAKDRQRFFRIAKGSLYEAAAILDLALVHRLIDAEKHEELIDRCDHIAAMLHRFR